MSKRVLTSIFILVVFLTTSLLAQAQFKKPKIGFLPGVVDPFYQVMQLGVEKAAKDLGVDVVTQIPPTWGVQVQTPLLDAMVARGDLNYIITAPTDKDQMVGPLKSAVDHGIKVITVDTFLGDGDYVNGPVKFPMRQVGGEWQLDKSYDGDKNTHPKGIIYLVTGAGGAGLYDPGQTDDPASWLEFTTKFKSNVHSLTLAEIDGRTAKFRQVSESGEILDSFMITK